MSAYFSSRTALESRYGPTNVALMADMDGDGNSTTITNRINDALLNADAWVYGHLRSSNYSHWLPNIVDRDGNKPQELVMCATMYAGYDLLRPSGFRDFDKDGKPLNRLYSDFQEAERMLEKIALRTIYLIDVDA